MRESPVPFTILNIPKNLSQNAYYLMRAFTVFKYLKLMSKIAKFW